MIVQPTTSKRLLAAAAVGAWMFASRAVHADPPSQRLPEFALEGTSQPTRRLGDYAGRVIIVVYEDSDSNHQNDPFKTELANRARTTGVPASVTLLPIANLDGYDFWPASGFARDAVRDAARTFAVEILIDWRGQLGRTLGLTRGQSHVLLVTPDRTVVYRHAGPMAPADRVQFFDLLTRVTSAP